MIRAMGLHIGDMQICPPREEVECSGDGWEGYDGFQQSANHAYLETLKSSASTYAHLKVHTKPKNWEWHVYRQSLLFQILEGLKVYERKRSWQIWEYW